MNVLITIGGLVVALVGQWLNRHESIPDAVVKLTLAGVGMVFYGLGHGWPAGFGPPFLEWLDLAWVYALALPGAASLIGLAPGMQSNSK